MQHRQYSDVLFKPVACACCTESKPNAKSTNADIVDNNAATAPSFVLRKDAFDPGGLDRLAALRAMRGQVHRVRARGERRLRCVLVGRDTARFSAAHFRLIRLAGDGLGQLIDSLTAHVWAYCSLVACSADVWLKRCSVAQS